MPKGLEILRKKIWNKLKGKINPRTKKPYTESEVWAIATSQYKKMLWEMKGILEGVK